MKRSLDKAGPPSPINIDTPEEDKEEQEEKKKKKKKKKKREEGQDVSQHVQINKEKTKRRRMEDKGSEVMERDKKRRKGGEEMREGVEEDAVKEGVEKKKKEKEKSLEEEMIEVVEEIVVKEGGDKKKKKKKKKGKSLEEEMIEVVEEIGVKEGGGEKKKKKKKMKKKKINKLGEETIEGLEEIVVKERREKKKLGEDTREGVGEDVVNGGEEKKKKKKKKKVVEKTIEVVEENMVNKDGERKKKKKKKKKVEETIVVVEENVNEGVKKKNPEEKGGEELPESRGGVVELNGDGEKEKTGTTQDAKKKKRKKKKKKRVISDGQREGDVIEENGGHETVNLPKDLLDSPDVREILAFHPTRSRQRICDMLRHDLHRFREFKKQGILLRKGRCTAKEKQQIMTNINHFLAVSGISSAQELFFPHRTTERSKEIRKLRAQHRFYEKMGEGLHRSCFQVFRIAKMMIEKELNHLGRFDDEENQMLQKLHTCHGNKWQEISKRMERSASTLRIRFGYTASEHGVWKSDEEGRLKQAMLAHLETVVGPQQTGSGSGPWLTRNQLCKNLPWMSISEKVPTRCWMQCRMKWFRLLRPKMASDHCPAFSGGVKAMQAKAKLINTLYNMDVDDQALIDWEEVAITIGEVSDYYVQQSFHRLKVTSVPGWSALSYPEIIDFLQEKVLPKLEDHLKEVGDTEVGDAETPCEDKYFLSRIFSSGEVDSGLTVA